MGGGAQQILWAQCERCEKWRKLPGGTAVDEGKPWYCWMSPDKRRNQCAAPEESYSDEDLDISSGEEVQAPVKKQKTSNKEKGGYAQPSAGMSASRNGFTYQQAPRKLAKHYQPAPGAKAVGSSPNNGLRQDVQHRPSPLSRGSGVAPSTSRPPLPAAPPPPKPAAGSNPGAPPSSLQPVPQGGGVGGPPASTAKGARGFAKAKKGYIGFQKLLGSGGVWSIAKGRGRTVTAPPHWMWESLATFAPHCATLAVEGADLYSASKYFEMSQPNGKQQTQKASVLGRLAMTLSSAVASAECARIPGVEEQAALSWPSRQNPKTTQPASAPGVPPPAPYSSVPGVGLLLPSPSTAVPLPMAAPAALALSPFLPSAAPRGPPVPQQPRWPQGSTAAMAPVPPLSRPPLEHPQAMFASPVPGPSLPLPVPSQQHQYHAGPVPGGSNQLPQQAHVPAPALAHSSSQAPHPFLQAQPSVAHAHPQASPAAGQLGGQGALPGSSAIPAPVRPQPAGEQSQPGGGPALGVAFSSGQLSPWSGAQLSPVPSASSGGPMGPMGTALPSGPPGHAAAQVAAAVPMGPMGTALPSPAAPPSAGVAGGGGGVERPRWEASGVPRVPPDPAVSQGPLGAPFMAPVGGALGLSQPGVSGAHSGMAAGVGGSSAVGVGQPAGPAHQSSNWQGAPPGASGHGAVSGAPPSGSAQGTNTGQLHLT